MPSKDAAVSDVAEALLRQAGIVTAPAGTKSAIDVVPEVLLVQVKLLGH